MTTITRRRRLSAALAVSADSPWVALAGPASAKPPSGFITGEAPQITIDPGLPSGRLSKPLISSGDELGDFIFEGIPDGVGIRPGAAKQTVDVYVAHEQSTVPFRGARDFEDASVSKLTLEPGPVRGKGRCSMRRWRFRRAKGSFACSANMAGPDQGLDSHVFFTGEETNDVVDGVQRGFAVVLDTESGEYTAVPGLGRLNHENTVVIPGGWEGLSMLTTDDTFSAATSQLYMYRADDQSALFADEGSLYAFRVTGVDGTPLADPTDPFNGANDYLDVGVGQSLQGEFIPVPRDVALGDQTALEAWSNANNVFQAIRLEDLAYDKNDPRTVYIADTGSSRVVSDTETGRMKRGDPIHRRRTRRQRSDLQDGAERR